MKQVDENLKILISLIRSPKGASLAFYLMIFSFVQFFFWVYIACQLAPEDSFLHDSLIRMSGMILGFLQGCIGIIVIIRQKHLKPKPVSGCFTLLQGFVICLGGWGLAVYALYYQLTKITP